MVSYTLAIPEDIRRQILLFTGGIVTLTLCVNATTMRWFLQKLGLTKVPSAKMLLDYSIKKQIADSTEKYLDKLKKREALEMSNWTLVEKFMPEQEQAPDVSILTRDVLADVRLRVLKKEKTACWSLYNEGIISNVSLRILVNALDEQYDRDGHMSLSQRKWIFKYYRQPLLIRRLKQISVVKNWWDRFSHEWVINGYDLGRGFIITQKEALKLVEEFEQSEVLSTAEKQALGQLRSEIQENINHIGEVLNSLSQEFPISYRCGVTRKAIRMLLANEKRAVNQFVKDGLLSEQEAKVLDDDLDERYDGLTTYRINQLLS